MRICYLLTFMLFSSSAWADAVRDQEELALLPTYCRGTQQIRWISNDPKPLEEYVAIYGGAYIHLHQYCWALNGENNASRIRDEWLRRSKLETSLAQMQYSMDNSPPTFSPLPEMYLSKARVLFKLQRDVEAVTTLFKATELKADYGPAYAQLGDYYQRIGDRRNAIKFYEQGLINTHKANANFFIKKIKKLDKNYKIALIRTPKAPEKTVHDLKPDQAASNVPPNLPDQIQPDTPASSPIPDDAAQPSDQPGKPNPYCRFCP